MPGWLLDDKLLHNDSLFHYVLTFSFLLSLPHYEDDQTSVEEESNGQSSMKSFPKSRFHDRLTAKSQGEQTMAVINRGNENSFGNRGDLTARQPLLERKCYTAAVSWNKGLPQRCKDLCLIDCL